MKTKQAPVEFLMIVLLLIPFGYLGVIWNQLPTMLPGHYDSNGQPDRYDPKGELTIVLAATTALLYVAFRLAPRFDPRAGLNMVLYQKIRWLVMLFWVVFTAWFWTISWRGIQPETLSHTLLVGLGLLIAGLGNLINSVKPNYFVGIRTPWTLESDVVWRKTHQLGGRMLLAGGLLGAVLALTVPTPYKVGAFVSVLILVALVPVVYSYVYFRQEKARGFTASCWKL